MFEDFLAQVGKPTEGNSILQANAEMRCQLITSYNQRVSESNEWHKVKLAKIEQLL